MNLTHIKLLNSVLLKKTLTMKKLLLLLAIIGIAFSSCNGKYTIAKRKYNKGFYVSRSSGNTTKPEQVAKNATVNNKSPEMITSEPLVSKNTAVSIDQLEELNIVNKVIKAEKNSIKPSSVDPKSTNLVASNNNQLPTINKTFKNAEINQVVSAKKGSSDANLIVLIILCFLWWLNLIAVYIHDGKDITLNFWITLLLDFTFIGGVIFSLLVVLDIVDLR